jgi:hypothetical protein
MPLPYAGSVTSRFRALVLTAALAAALPLALAACSASPSPATTTTTTPSTASARDCTGVTVVVDTGDLKVADSPDRATCVAATGSVLGADAVKKAGLTIVGTAKYPEAVVCRVNGVPSAQTDLPGANGGTYHEDCSSMPPANAYWALWVKPKGGAWDYAQSGLSSLQLKPGDSVELLFTLNNKPASPAPVH